LAAVDYFLKIAGIDGESTAAKHKGEIDVESWSWGTSMVVSHAYGGAGARASANDFSFVMKLNKASPKLFLALSSGKHIESAWLTAQRPGKQTDYFLKWSFADVLISSYQTGAAAGDSPADQVAFNFAKIEMEYKEQKPDGSLGETVKTGWDFQKNEKI
jgi:type VI secretion system secreted protein Hcp